MKLAIITSHPIQYYAPWFRHIASTDGIDLRVFYLWDFGTETKIDPEFKLAVKWDIPLLDGYEYEFVANTSSDPGTHHFKGLVNPGLMRAVGNFAPDAVLMMLYNYQSAMNFILRWNSRRAPLLFRGDSHRLAASHSVKDTLRRVAITRLFRRFGALLYVGQANREYYKLHGVPDRKLFFAPHAVDNERFIGSTAQAEAEANVWRRELQIPDDAMVVLFAGKLIEKKRPLDLLQAFRAIDVPNAHLLFVGSGELEARLREEAEGNARVHFAPFQNQSQMPRTYAAADLFVLPSYGPSETWGLAVNEAMCLARPALVSTHVGCARDLIRPGENGLIFEAGNATDLAVKLKTALHSREQLAAWGKCSREIVESYSYSATTAGLCEALRSLGLISSPRASQELAGAMAK